MNDTCTTHRSRVPRRSFGRVKGGVTTVEDERGPGLGFSLCFVCGSRPLGAAAFLLCLFILLLKCVKKINKNKNKNKISVRFPDTLPLGPQPAERFTRGAVRWYWTSLVDGPMLLHLLAVGGGSSGRWQPAASPPFPAPPQTWRMAAGFGLQANGGDSSAPSWMAATPPRQEHGSESSVPPVLLLLQHHRFGQPLAVSATSCCPIFSAPRSQSAARAL